MSENPHKPHESQPEIQVYETEEEVIKAMEQDSDEPLTEQEKNLAIAQARLIGELD